MREIIIVRQDRCIGCGTCIRSCPAPESNIIKKLENGKLISSVDPSKCIGCGECIKSCRRNARDYIDDTEQFMEDIKKQEIILIADPSIKAAFPLQWTTILDWFKSNNCLVFDGALGADIYVWAFLSLIESGKMKNMISTFCPAVMNYIKTYRSSLMKKLAPIYPPDICSSIYIRNYLKKDNKIAVLTPCTARKLECTDTGFIDYSVTFKKLMEYFSRNEISIPYEKPDNYDYSYMDTQGQLGAIMGHPGGFMQNILFRKSEACIESAHGADRIYSDLDEYDKQSENELPSVFDVLSCGHGCALSSGCGTEQSYFEISADLRSMESEAKEKLKGKGKFRGIEDKLFKKFDDDMEIDNFLRMYRSVKSLSETDEEDIEKGFALIEKNDKTAREYNCGACGYSTCREMALAISKGNNCPESCTEYRKKHSKPLSDDEKKYEDILKNCKETIKNLENGILSMSGDLGEISASSDKAAEKAKNIKELMNNVVEFCNKNTTMNENNIQQMKKILQTTIKSLVSLEDNIVKASHDSHFIINFISEINGQISHLKGIVADDKALEAIALSE